MPQLPSHFRDYGGRHIHGQSAIRLFCGQGLCTNCAARAAAHWKESAPRQKAFAIRLRGLGHKLQCKSKLNFDLQEALSLSRRAVEICTRLRSPNLPAAQALLAEIEETMKIKRG
jgi:6-phosphofructokinase